METRARLNSIDIGYGTKKLKLTLEIDNVQPKQLEELRNKDLRLRLVQWRDKRSLDQNSYFWVLVGKIAMELGSTPEEVHASLIQDYPIMWTDKDGQPALAILHKKHRGRGAQVLGGYWKLTDMGNDKFDVYLKLKGTSDMDTKEMSWFLDRTIEEAQELGIETITPDELARMRNALVGV